MLFEQQTSFGILKRDVKIGLICRGGETEDRFTTLNFIPRVMEKNNLYSIYIQNVDPTHILIFSDSEKMFIHFNLLVFCAIMLNVSRRVSQK